MITKSIEYGEKFVVSLVEKNTVDTNEIAEFLRIQEYKYEDLEDGEFRYFLVQCDDFQDAAKLETFLQSGF